MLVITSQRQTPYMYKKRYKYGNSKVIVDDIVFDSKKEARRYEELKMLEKAGEIKNLQRQVKYELVPEQREPETVVKGKTKRGKLIERAVTYLADFVYEDARSGNTVVEDVKSEATRTKEYIIKRKLMLYIHGIRISEI